MKNANLSRVALASVMLTLFCQCSPPALTGVSVANSGGGDDMETRGIIKQTPAIESDHYPTSEGIGSGQTQVERPADSRTVTHVETGKSSWYSVKTNGGTKTASGIPFSDYKYTVAHRTLPFGTLVRVTNLNNGKSVEGRVTDRGPFIKGRIVDLSLVMAKEIDAYHVGIAPCKLEVLAK